MESCGSRSKTPPTRGSAFFSLNFRNPRLLFFLKQLILFFEFDRSYSLTVGKGTRFVAYSTCRFFCGWTFFICSYVGPCFDTLLTCPLFGSFIFFIDNFWIYFYWEAFIKLPYKDSFAMENFSAVVQKWGYLSSLNINVIPIACKVSINKLMKTQLFVV